MRRLEQWDSKVLGLNSTDGLGWAGLWDSIHYEAPGSLQVRDVIVSCSKLALGQLVQIQVMDSVSDKILKFYIYIKSKNL